MSGNEETNNEEIQDTAKFSTKVKASDNANRSAPKVAFNGMCHVCDKKIVDSAVVDNKVKCPSCKQEFKL